MPDGTTPQDEAQPAPRGPEFFYRSIVEFLRDLPGTAKRFWFLVIVVGVAAGLVATGFLHLLRAVQVLVWPPADTYFGAVVAASPLRRVIVTSSAGVLITLMWLLTRRRLSGHGTPGVIEAIWVKEGRLSLPRAFLRDASSIIAVSMGASLGREGALIQTGAASGSWLARRLRLPGHQARLLVACGAAAGISAAYNTPIGGALFGLEVLLGSFALELFGPIVVACVISTMLSRLFIEPHAIYVAPHVSLMTPRDFLLAILLGPVLGIISAGYIKGIDGLAQLLGRIRPPVAYALPPIVMAGLGLVSIRFPELLGNGYDTVERSLVGTIPLSLLFVLPVMKFAATAACSAGGIPGGLFTPSLYVGALFGAGLGSLLHTVWPSSTPAGAYALVGMGGILAGTTHAAVSSVLIVFELTGNYEIILPLMVACVLSAVFSRMLEGDSIYTSALARRQVYLPEHPRPTWLRDVRVSAIYRPDFDSIASSAPFSELVLKLLSLPAGRDLYVLAPDGRLLGIIILDALKGHLPDEQLLRMIVAADVMDTTVEPVTPELPLSELAARFSKTYLDKLPVVDGSGKLVGTVSKSDLLAHGRF